MKKIIALLFNFILLTSITACFSESPDKLYGVYKDVNEERDREGYIITISISDNRIKFNTIGSIANPILPPEKEGDFWIAKNPNNKNIVAKIKELAPNTIEYTRVRNGQEKSLGKYVKITEEEFKTIQNTPIKPELKEFPSLF